MEKTQKLVDVWVARDGREFFNAFKCEEHERQLDEEKSQTQLALMCLATDQWRRDNPEEHAAMERRVLGIDEFGRTQSEAMVDEFLGFDPLPRDTEWFNECRHDRFMQFGIELGWWEGVGANGEPIAPAIVVKISELEEHETLMAHVIAKQGFFTSVNEAKKNGWNKPVEPGEFWFRKKTVCLRIVD